MPKLAKSPRTLGLLAAGLLMATTLTTATMMSMSPAVSVEAQTAIAFDPSRGVADLVDRVMPAVVSVQVKFANVAGESDGEQMSPNIPEEFFKQFPQFRQGQPFQGPQRRDGMAQGSGFIISADGYAVTNNHVVKDASEVNVKLEDGSDYDATVIGTDPMTDLALIKIKADKPFKFVKFSSTEPRVGDWVMAVGNPFGLGGSVTTGIISARGRDIGSGPYDEFLQIDASINRGNSGGPAFNLEGEVVGVNTAIFSPSGGSVGIGFAIPATTAESVIGSLQGGGSVTRGWLGVQIQPVTSEIAESLGLATSKGAIVSDVTDDSPALAAGLKTGDTILKVDGKDIADARDLAKRVARIKPNSPVPVTIVRDGKTMDVAVTIGTMPEGQRMASAGGNSGGSVLKGLGIQVAPAADGEGVTVTGVEPNSRAAEYGLKQGDVILEVAGKEVRGTTDIRDALKSNGKKRVLMLVRSGDSKRFLTLPPNQG
ncbi:MAG: Do family serine endopeptidase [Rhizobiales bacterium]|nr:Do family serine endopeptidase [Hyphomicrobiales bacterium]